MSCMVRSKLMYCNGCDWWMTLPHLGHVLFSSKCFTKQLLQTENAKSYNWFGQSNSNKSLFIFDFRYKRRRKLTCVQTFGDCGRIYKVAAAYFASDMLVQRMQFYSSFHRSKYFVTMYSEKIDWISAWVSVGQSIDRVRTIGHLDY